MTAAATLRTEPSPIRVTPEPMPDLDRPSRWRAVPLVEMMERQPDESGGTTTSLRIGYAGNSLKGIAQFRDLKADSLREAVAAAHELGASAVGRSTKSGVSRTAELAPAMGVLQAHDGAWYATVLSPQPSATLYWVAPPENDLQWEWAEAKLPAFKALVGQDQWVNFTDEKFELELAPKT